MRHEQREGRVDRFGQRADTVRTVTYYGEDNGIDGIVLQVLIKRHENIRRSTGVSVPIPVDSTTVMKAIWESLLLRGTEADQLTLDFADATSGSLADALDVQWIDAAEREKASRSRFRQAGLQPDAVAATLAEVRRSLGGPADAETFTRNALSLMSAQLTDTADGFTARIDTLPPAVRDQLPPAKDHRLHFHDSFPVPTGHSVLARTDPTVEALSRYVLDAALDADLDPILRPARRAGVIRSAAVKQVTTLLVVRFRLEITLPGSRATITQVAEDAQFLAFTTTGDDLTWLTTGQVDALLTVPATGNVADTLARTQLDRALSRLDVVGDHLQAIGDERADAIVADHRAVRSASRAGGRAVTAELLPPPDVLGLYVFLPEMSTS